MLCKGLGSVSDWKVDSPETACIAEENGGMDCRSEGLWLIKVKLNLYSSEGGPLAVTEKPLTRVLRYVLCRTFFIVATTGIPLEPWVAK